jgi:hypothetical protein
MIHEKNLKSKISCQTPFKVMAILCGVAKNSLRSTCWNFLQTLKPSALKKLKCILLNPVLKNYNLHLFSVKSALFCPNRSKLLYPNVLIHKCKEEIYRKTPHHKI